MRLGLEFNNESSNFQNKKKLQCYLKYMVILSTVKLFSPQKAHVSQIHGSIMADPIENSTQPTTSLKWKPGTNPKIKPMKKTKNGRGELMGCLNVNRLCRISE